MDEWLLLKTRLALSLRFGNQRNKKDREFGVGQGQPPGASLAQTIRKKQVSFIRTCLAGRNNLSVTVPFLIPSSTTMVRELAACTSSCRKGPRSRHTGWSTFQSMTVTLPSRKP